MSLQTRRLGQTGLTPTVLSMGCAWLGRQRGGDLAGIQAVRRAWEHGITFFDTDPGYAGGRSEPLLGQALSAFPRDSFYLSTKVGTRPGQTGDFSARGVRLSVEESLRVLGTDFLDLLLIHDPADIEPPFVPGAAVDEMCRMKEEGLIHAIGLGCRPHRFHVRAIQSGKVDVVLTFKDCTLLNQSAISDTVPLACLHQVGVILASVLDIGFLSGERPDAVKAPRAYAMWEWAREHGKSIRDFALRFAVRLPIPGMVLAGPATREQVDQDIRSATTPISTELWQEFENAFGVSPDSAARELAMRKEQLAGGGTVAG